MKKILALMMSAVLVLSACGEKKETAENANQKPVVKIGVMLPLTGEISEFGVNSKYAIEIALEEHENSPIEFEVIFEDDTFTPSRAATLAHKFINVDKVDAVVTTFSPVGSAVAPLTEKAGVFHMSLSNASNIAKGKINFLNWQQLDIAAKKLVDHLKAQGVKKIVSFNMERIGNEEMRVKTNEFLDKENIEYKEFSFLPNNKDFALTVLKAKEFDADYWILNSYSPALELLRKEMIAQHIEVPVINIQNMGMSNYPELFENQVFVDAPDGDKHFRDKMSKETKSQALNIPAYAYDIINLIIAANEEFYKNNGRIANDEELAETLKKTKIYQGTVGKLEVGNDGIIRSRSVLKRIVNGKPVIIEDQP